jgi:HEAT repeat protein
LLTSLVFAGVISVGASGLRAADPNDPVDPKLRKAYQRIRFASQYPPDAAQFIQAQLQATEHPLKELAALAEDPRPEVRVLVALLVGEYGESDGSKILWRLTQDEFESVRLSAAGGLARLTTLTAVTPITDGLRDPRAPVRRLTASILGAIADKSAEDALIDTLEDENELVRTDVVKALSKAACGTDRALPGLIKRLEDPRVNVRDRTAQVLGGHPNPLVVEPLIRALKDPDWHVRAAAADSLGGWVKKEPDVIPPLLDVLANDDFSLVRDRAADALGNVGNDDQVAPALARSLCEDIRSVRIHAAQAIIAAKATKALPLLMEQRHHRDPMVREKIMDIFGYLGGSEQLDAIMEATSDSEPQVQIAAVNALRRLRERGAVVRLIERLDDPNPHVRAATARALGDLGDKTAAVKIVRLLGDENGYVRGAAAEALGKLGDRSSIGPLIEVLTGGRAPSTEGRQDFIIGAGKEFVANLELTEVQQKTRAIEALGALRATEAVDPIIGSGLRASDPTIRAASAYALGQIGDRRAVEPLQDTVRGYYAVAPTDLSYIIDPGREKLPDETRRQQEKESRVRASVAWALGQLGDPAAKDTLLKAVNDQNSLVRDAALEALAKITEREEAERLGAQSPSKKTTPSSGTP